MPFRIVGAGLAGATLAALLPNSVLYEKDKPGGLCKDNENYQEFIHILHTDYEDVWKFVNNHTTVRPHTTRLLAYVNGELKQHPPKEMTDEVIKTQYEGYSKKMWQRPTPPEALARCITSEDGLIFHEKYQGIPDFTRLFENLTRYTDVINLDIRDGDLDGKIILTGAIDEYFNYCFGKLPYRGMQAVHYPSETSLPADFVTFSDEIIPFQRLVDYGRLGYGDTWIGVESACNAKHYPIRDEESEKIYAKYRALADEKGILLVGRLATYRYQDMDEVMRDAIDLARKLNNA